MIVISLLAVLLIACAPPCFAFGATKAQSLSSATVQRFNDEVYSARVTLLDDAVRASPLLRAAQPSGCNGCMLVISLIFAANGDHNLFNQTEAICERIFPDKTSSLRKDCDEVAKIISNFLPGVAKLAYSRDYSPYHLCSMLEKCVQPCCLDDGGAPEQVQISPGKSFDKMKVLWVTSLLVKQTSVVQYGQSASQMNNVGQSEVLSTYTAGGWRGLIHNVTLSNLKPSTTYFYRVGNSANGFSKTFQFRTLPPFNAKGAALRFVITGDFGSESYGDALATKLTTMVAKDEFDIFVHNGDTAYADGVEHAWDVFMRKLEPVQAQKYTLRSVGNHEIIFNFRAYLSRFSPPAAESHSPTSLYYSVDIGNVHFVTLSGEGADDQAYVPDDELTWLKGDLQRWNATRTPNQWLVAQIHRGLYCGSGGTQMPWYHNTDCVHYAQYLRKKFEDLLYAYGASIVLQAHKHDYERTARIYQSQRDAAGPYYVTVGNGGNREGLTCDWLKPAAPFFEAQVCEWGYAFMTANDTNLELSFYHKMRTINTAS